MDKDASTSFLVSSNYAIQDVHVDLYMNHDPHFVFDMTDYQIFAEINDKNAEESVKIVVRRLDHHPVPDGLQLLLLYKDLNEIIQVPVYDNSSEIHIYTWNCKDQIQKIHDIERPIVRFPIRTQIPFPIFQRVSREEFNTLFFTKLSVLPTSIFAIGKIDLINYLYHEGLGEQGPEFNNIKHLLHHIFHVAKEINQSFCFIISSTDGYPENVPWSDQRTQKRYITNQECLGQYLPPVCSLTEYPIYESDENVKGNPIHLLAQSAHVDFPDVLLIPDRHYFYHHLYHPFRSFHQGIPLEKKKPKIIYAGQARDSPLNFINLSMQNIGIAPREYVKKVLTPIHSTFLECNGTWMDRRDMIHYKYILDLDGAASTWDATAWKLNSGSVIIKPKSIWKQWFYHLYLPGIHYVEINNNLSNIHEVYTWCENHPEECQTMIQNAQKLFQSVYAYENVFQYTKTVLEQCIMRKDDVGVLVHDTPPFILGNYIDKIIYINLDKRTDRRKEIEEQLDDFGLSYERFPAIYHPFGIVGCTQSHQAVLRLAKERGYKRVWILEDDFQFLQSREEIEATIQSMCSKQFDVCMFAYNALKSTNENMEWSEGRSPSHRGRSPPNTTNSFAQRGNEVTERVWLQIYEAETASSYVVQEHYYDKLIELYNHTIPLLEQTQQHWNYANDQSWKILQTSDHWIAPFQRMGKQRDGFSDNAQEYMSYGF